MCGIWFHCVKNSNTCLICNRKLGPPDPTEFVSKMLELHTRRGPDLSTSFNESEINGDDIDSFSDPESFAHSHLFGHVLWTQGPFPVSQPYSSPDKKRFLLFNGDIYSFSGAEAYEEKLFHPETIHDGINLFNLLSPNGLHQTLEEFENNLVAVVGRIRGPFAFVLVDLSLQAVWFGRDFFGRQSLLFSTNEDRTSVNISSVSISSNVYEIPAAGVYRLDLARKGVSLMPFDFRHRREDVLKNLAAFSQFLENQCGISSELEQETENSVASIPMNFSAELLPEFDKDDRDFQKLVALSQRTDLDVSDTLREVTRILDPYISKFLEHLRRAIHLRLKAVAPLCKNCVTGSRQFNSSNKCDHPRVGILFSGGLDSTVLAYLVCEAVDKVDLLNVAFSKSESSSDFDSVPDRETGIMSFEALRKCFEGSGKEINLVLVNRRKNDVVEMRRKRIRDLIAPHKSVIDDSVGCCLWFASSGKSAEYESPARMMMLGSGADELLGGYSRHRTAFERSSWDGLWAEMQFDLDRLSIRNMGRDNRVVSDHGLSPRMPYLDEGLVHFLTHECPIWVKCFPMLGGGARGLGEKILLRASALKLLGPENYKIAAFPKRAMQFGSRIAKLENSKEKGADYCDRLD